MRPDHPALATARRPAWRDVLATGTLASLVSGVALAWRGLLDNCSAFAPINAPSHWVWGREALRRDDATLRHTALGAAIHHASSLFWAAFYALLRQRRRGTDGALRDAAAISVIAAAVDLTIVPPRLTPGFEQRLSDRSLVWVYAGFAAGLALGTWVVRRR